MLARDRLQRGRHGSDDKNRTGERRGRGRRRDTFVANALSDNDHGAAGVARAAADRPHQCSPRASSGSGRDLQSARRRAGMSDGLRAFLASLHLEVAHLRRNRIFLALTAIEAITFLVLVSLFGLTGSRDPTALVDNDNSALSPSFVASLKAAHDSFNIEPMSLAEAQQKLDRGDLVAIIEIP